MAAFTVDTVGWSHAIITVTGLSAELDGGDAVRVFARLYSGANAVADITAVATDSYRCGIYNLSPGTKYAVNVSVNSIWLGAQSFTTIAEPSLAVRSVAATSVTLSMSGLTTGAVYQYVILPADHLDTDDPITRWTFTASSATANYTCSGLSPGTEYIAFLSPKEWVADYVDAASVLFATPTRPPDWEWSSTIVSGGEIGLTAQEWSDFCGRINEFLVYLGLSERTFTAVSPGTPISAAIVNGPRTVINSMPGRGSTIPNAVTVGTSITADFFIRLKNALNAIP